MLCWRKTASCEPVVHLQRTEGFHIWRCSTKSEFLVCLYSLAKGIKCHQCRKKEQLSPYWMGHNILHKMVLKNIFSTQVALTGWVWTCRQMAEGFFSKIEKQMWYFNVTPWKPCKQPHRHCRSICSAQPWSVFFSFYFHTWNCLEEDETTLSAGTPSKTTGKCPNKNTFIPWNSSRWQFKSGANNVDKLTGHPLLTLMLLVSVLTCLFVCTWKAFRPDKPVWLVKIMNFPGQ